MDHQKSLLPAPDPKRPTLDEMLARFDPLRHGETWLDGAPVGKERFWEDDLPGTTLPPKA